MAKYIIQITNEFKKTFKLCKKRGKIRQVLILISFNESIDLKYIGKDGWCGGCCQSADACALQAGDRSLYAGQGQTKR